MLIALREPVFVFASAGGGRRKAMLGPGGPRSPRVMGFWQCRAAAPAKGSAGNTMVNQTWPQMCEALELNVLLKSFRTFNEEKIKALNALSADTPCAP